MLMRMQIRKKQILYIVGRDDQIATSAKLLDITHKSSGISADLRNRDY